MHDSGTTKKVEPKKELGMFVHSQTKANLTRESVVSERSDEAGVLEEKRTGMCLE